jgi:hypothetical protein
MTKWFIVLAGSVLLCLTVIGASQMLSHHNSDFEYPAINSDLCPGLSQSVSNAECPYLRAVQREATRERACREFPVETVCGDGNWSIELKDMTGSIALATRDGDGVRGAASHPLSEVCRVRRKSLATTADAPGSNVYFIVDTHRHSADLATSLPSAD